MPEITRREIEKHIADRAKDAHSALEKLRRKNLTKPPFDAIAKGTTVEAIEEELLAQFTDFCKVVKVTHLPAKDIDLSMVLDAYFAQKPPFCGGKKKNEFPDAFSAQLLTAWCKKKSRKVVVVSGDSDWGAVEDKHLEILDTVAKFLNRFPDPIIANEIRAALTGSKYLEKRLMEEFAKLELRDRDHDIEISDVEAADVVLGEFYVIDITDGLATVEADATFNFSAYVTGHRSYRSYRYDDGEDNYVSTTVHGTKTLTATIEVEFDPKNLSDLSISVSLGGISRHIDIKLLFD